MTITQLQIPRMQKWEYHSHSPYEEEWVRTSPPMLVRYDYVNRPTADKRKRPTPLFLNPTGWSCSQFGWASPVSDRLRPNYDIAGTKGFVQWTISDFTNPAGQDLLANEPSDSLRLQNKAVADIKGNGVNLANMLGEYKQTASMFGSLSKDVAALTLAVIKRDPRILLPRGRWDKTLARRHLEYVYGVSPFVQDMNGAVKALRQRLNGPRPIVLPVHHTIRADRYASGFLDGMPKEPIKWYGRSLRTTSLHGYYTLRNVELLSAFGQYGVTNPLATAWELTPFSFVVDWWLNIGEVLDSLDSILYVDQTRSIGTVSVKSSGRTDYLLWDVHASGFYRKYSRSVINMPVQAQLRYKPSLSRQHIANGLALFTTGAFTNFKLPWRRT